MYDLIKKRLILGITGASGSILAQNMIAKLYDLGVDLDLIITDNGKKVWQYELDQSFENFIKVLEDSSYTGNAHIKNIQKNDVEIKEPMGSIRVHDNSDLFASVASGSYRTDGMIIVPCSMSTIGKIAHGISDSLLTRAADVCIKERRQLVLIPRETPLSPIHLENMLSLSRIGTVIAPPVPIFYHKPSSLEQCYDDLSDRLLAVAGIDVPGKKTWS